MPKIRNIIIFTVIAAVLILIYIFFVRSSGEQASLVSSSPAPSSLPGSGGSVAGALGATSITAEDFLNLLLSVKSIKLDSSVLSDVAFNSLRDSSIVLTPDGNEGRPNPFAQFGNDALPISSENTPATTPATTPL